MLTPLVACAVSALSVAYCFRVLQRCKALSRVALTEQDPLELELAQKALSLQLALGLRSVRTLARATLFSGTGLAVWELTGGSAHYPQAAVCFVLGFAGWAGCAEVERRVGPLAGGRRVTKPTR